MTGMLEKFVICLVIVGICAGVYFYCDKENIELLVSEPVEYKGEPVSSTRIRNAIRNGNIEDANNMLGREFSYDFLVVHGDARGRTIDSPTIFSH